MNPDEHIINERLSQLPIEHRVKINGEEVVILVPPDMLEDAIAILESDEEQP